MTPDDSGEWTDATVRHLSAGRRPGPELRVGDVLNNIFRVKRFISKGGMGAVYEGCNINTDEPVAIKIMLPALAENPKIVSLFRREARTLTKLQHEALVRYRVLAEDSERRVFYIVTEYIDGIDLAEYLKRRSLQTHEVIGLFGRLAAGLAAAHQIGAIHRDISPDNILLPQGQLDQAKIIDFGIAKDMGGEFSTIVGEGFAGKLAYAAPEQLGEFDGAIGTWTDVYSLGLVMLAAASGRESAMGGSYGEAVNKRLAGPDLSYAPESLRPLLASMLHADPRRRLQSMEDVLRRLAEPLSPRPSVAAAPRSRLAAMLHRREAPAAAQDQRRRRARFVKYSLVLSLFALTATVAQNVNVFTPDATGPFVLWSIGLAFNLVIFLAWTGSPLYVKHRFVDLIIALPMIIMMNALRDVIGTQSAVTEFSAAITVMGNGVVAVSFASVFFSGYFRGFAIWCAMHAITFFDGLIATDASPIMIGQTISVYLPILAVSLYANWSISREGEDNYTLRQVVAEEKAKSEELLYNVLPEEIAERLRRGEAIADAYSDATVVFVDIVGSSALARSLAPKHFVQVLNGVFSIADKCCQREGIEKVKTIGDAYLAIAGARGGGDAVAAVRFGRSVVAMVKEWAAQQRLDLDVRVGIHSGPVVGGIIGEMRATYDYWGDTMNVAARAQGAAEVGGIAVTEQTYYATRDYLRYHPARSVMLKGIGETKIFDVA